MRLGLRDFLVEHSSEPCPRFGDRLPAAFWQPRAELLDSAPPGCAISDRLGDGRFTQIHGQVVAMQYSVDVTLQTDQPLTEANLLEVAELGGVAVGRPGDRRLETTLTVEAADAVVAGRRAAERVCQRVAGVILAVDAMTAAEADGRLQRAEDRRST